MTKTRFNRRLLMLMFLCFTLSLQAQLQSLQTRDLRLIYYSKAHEYVVPHLARCFENALAFHRRVFNYTPGGKMTVLLQDFGDYGNAGAAAIPRNFIKVGISPFSYIYGTMPANERMNWVMNHELVHIVTTDKPTGGSERFFRRLFAGKAYPVAEDPPSIFFSYLTAPRVFTPRWYREGIAVFMETWMAGGLGRALNGYDEMVFRTMVRDGSYIYHMVGLEAEGTSINFQVGVNSYLYGTRFMTYLAYLYGPQKLLDWTSQDQQALRGFGAQFKRTYGISLSREWGNWIEWERQWQQANLDSIRRNPVTPFRPLTETALGSVSRLYYHPETRELFAATRMPGQLANIVAIDTESGDIRKITDISGAALFYVTSLAYDPASSSLFYTTDNHDWRDLHLVDTRSGKSRRLMKDCRVGDLAYNPQDQSLWGVRHYIGISTIVRIPYPYREWHQVYSLPYGEDIFDIDISPDGRTLAGVIAEVNGSQKLIKMDTGQLLQGNHAYDLLFDFEYSYPANFVFSPDGRYLYGSSYYSGVSNLYRYDLDAADINIISNGETGFFRPVPLGGDSLIAIRYTGDGFWPVKIPDRIPETVGAINFLGHAAVQRHTLLKDWRLGSPATVNLDSLTTFSGAYRPLANLRPVSLYPVVQGYKNYPAFGLRLDLADYLNLTAMDIKASYAPNPRLPAAERLHLGMKLRYWNWQISASYNRADFYDLFGPTKTSRKGYSLGVEYQKSLLHETPKLLDLTLSATGYADLDRLPFFQNVAAPVNEFATFGAVLNYQRLQKSLGAVDPECGSEWRLTSYNYLANSELFPHLITDFNYGILLPLRHSSLWLRTSGGISGGDRQAAFANDYFGGFGNNWVDFQTTARFREYYSFPGVGLNQIEGQNFVKVLLEGVLPPLRFRRFGVPGFYLNWTRLSLFGSGLVTDLQNEASRRQFANIGGQLDFRIIFFSALETTLSLGYAVAAEKDRRRSDEFMISLKIL